MRKGSWDFFNLNYPQLNEVRKYLWYLDGWRHTGGGRPRPGESAANIVWWWCPQMDHTSTAEQRLNHLKVLKVTDKHQQHTTLHLFWGSLTSRKRTEAPNPSQLVLAIVKITGIFAEISRTCGNFSRTLYWTISQQSMLIRSSHFWSEVCKVWERWLWNLSSNFCQTPPPPRHHCHCHCHNHQHHRSLTQWIRSHFCPRDNSPGIHSKKMLKCAVCCVAPRHLMRWGCCNLASSVISSMIVCITFSCSAEEFRQKDT